jgi:hypothetical protein
MNKKELLVLWSLAVSTSLLIGCWAAVTAIQSTYVFASMTDSGVALPSWGWGNVLIIPALIATFLVIVLIPFLPKGNRFFFLLLGIGIFLVFAFQLTAFGSYHNVLYLRKFGMLAAIASPLLWIISMLRVRRVLKS